MRVRSAINAVIWKAPHQRVEDMALIGATHEVEPRAHHEAHCLRTGRGGSFTQADAQAVAPCAQPDARACPQAERRMIYEAHHRDTVVVKRKHGAPGWNPVYELLGA